MSIVHGFKRQNLSNISGFSSPILAATRKPFSGGEIRSVSGGSYGRKTVTAGLVGRSLSPLVYVDSTFA